MNEFLLRNSPTQLVIQRIYHEMCKKPSLKDALMFSKLTKFPMNQLIFKLLDKHYESSSVDRNAAIKSNSTSGTNEESKALDELIQLNCRHWNDFEIVQLFLKTMNPNVFENHHFKDLNLILKFSLLIYGDKIFEQVSDLLDVQIGSMLNDNADLKLVKFEYYPIVLKNSQDGFVKWKVLVDDLVQFISGCCSKESIGIEKNDQNTSIEKERNFDIDSRLQQFKIDWILARQAFDSLEIPKTTSTNTAMNVLHELVAYAAKRYDNEEKLYIENLFNSLLNLHLNQFDEYYEILKLLMQMDTSLADQMSFLESSLDPLNYSVRNSDFLHSCIVYHSKARSLCNFVDKCYNICQEHNWLYDDTIFNDYLLDCIEKVISGVLEVQVFQLIQSLVGYTFNEFEHSSKKAAVKRACTIFGLLLLRCIRVFKGPNKKYFQEFLLGLYNNHLNSIFCDEIHSLDIEMCLRINFVAMQVCDAYCGYLDNSRMKNMAVKYKDAKNEYVGETLLLYIDYCISKNIESHELAMILWEMGLSPPVLMDYISVLGHHPAEKHLARLLKNVIHGNVVVIPEFYECLAVKDLLVPILIKIAGKLFKTHDVKLGFFLSSLNKKISLEHAQFVVGHNFTTFEDENGVTQVISFLETVPIQFFTTVQLEQLQLLLFVIEKSVPLTNTLRKLTSKFLLQKVDRSLLFFHPSTLLHFVQTCQISAYKESLDIALACISKLLERNQIGLFKNSIVKDTVVYWRKILEYLNESLSDSRNSLLLLAVLKSISKLNLATIDFIAKPVYKLAKSSIKQRNTSTEIEYELVNACLDFVTVYKPKSKNKIVSSVGKYSSRGFTVELKIKHEPIQDSFDYVAGIMEEIWKCENRLGSLIVEFIQNCPQNCYQHLLNCLEQAVSNNSSLIASSGALQSFQILVKVSNSQSKEFQSLISSKISIWISLFQDFVHESSSAVLILEAFTTVTTLIKSVNYDLQVFQVSLALDLIISLQTNTEFNVGSFGHQLFKEMYNLLYALIKFRRQQIIHLIPHFSYCVNAMINAIPTTESFVDCKKFNKPCSIPCLAGNLNAIESSKLAVRLVEEMHQKPRGETDALIKPFTKHVPFLLITLIHNSHFKLTIGDNWQMMGYLLLDSCDEHGRKYVLRNIKGSEDIYKKLVKDWEANHRYKGNS